MHAMENEDTDHSLEMNGEDFTSANSPYGPVHPTHLADGDSSSFIINSGGTIVPCRFQNGIN